MMKTKSVISSMISVLYGVTHDKQSTPMWHHDVVKAVYHSLKPKKMVTRGLCHIERSILTYH